MDSIVQATNIFAMEFTHTPALLFLLPGLPLLGAVMLMCMLGFPGRWHALLAWLATLISFASFVIACFLFQGIRAGSGAIETQAWQWFSVGSLQVSFGLRFDALAGVMALVISGVGSLIHMYSLGYMSDDPHRPRFFCYLNLFLFAMLVLVLADNLLLLFVGWEGVGLCSYLLIGFWFKEMANAKAGQKAFVVNRIGDAGFLLGMFLLFWATKSLQFEQIERLVPGLPANLIEVAAFLLLIGAVGKSAQIPLFVWLPDAMAGPTPVSALIHAATMVTAGVYLIARLGVLYTAAPLTSVVISVIGCATALFAASIALAQNDIKKVLAYSTVSQLGYMFMALGAGAFASGIYHVVTHAFFKACLFMAAGSVIIGCHHEQDMRRFGGLWGRMVVTFSAYLVATYTIVGLPFASGFYSKDSILWSVYSAKGLLRDIVVFGDLPLATLLWGLGVFTAFLTACYMTRSLVLTFFGSYRGSADPSESDWTILVPLAVLMALSILFGGMFGDRLVHFLSAWTRPDLLVAHEVLLKNETYLFLEHTTTYVVLGGVVLSLLLFTVGEAVVDIAAYLLSPLHIALVNKWWIDEIYDLLIVQPLRAFSSALYHVVDCRWIDSLANGCGVVVMANGEIVRRMHSGKIASYLMLLFASVIFVLVFWMIL